jgi:restriction endonuclease Mrr
LIECKKYSPENHVGIDVVQRLLGAIYQYDATQGVVTTTSALTRDAIKLVNSKPHRLAAHEYVDVVTLLWRVRLIVVPTPELWLPSS